MRARKETALNSKSDAYTPYMDSKEHNRRWRLWKAPRLTGANLWPKTTNTNTKRFLESNYRAMPEEFYFETQLPAVTPENLEDWMDHMSIYHVEVQERMSGSSRFSRRAATQ
eukprot:7313287-Pyramimonas_sp.AAC.1